MKPADSNPYTIKTRRIKGEPDMQDTLESKLELFNSFSQPVILVREGKVVYANHAAAACGIDAAQDAGEFVEEADEGLRLRLGSICARAQRHELSDAVLYIADEYWEGARFSPDTLLNVAQAMRTPLTDMFTVSAPLFVTLEEMEDPALSRAAASLNKSFYQLLRLMCDLTEMPAVAEGNVKVRLEKLELCAFLQSIFTQAESLCRTLPAHHHAASAGQDRPHLGGPGPAGARNLQSDCKRRAPHAGGSRNHPFASYRCVRRRH